MRSDDARRVLDAAKARAQAMTKAVTIIVVDAAAFTAVVAEGKACASTFMGRDSGEPQGMTERFPALVAGFATRLGGRFVALQGGVVLREDGAGDGAVVGQGAGVWRSAVDGGVAAGRGGGRLPVHVLSPARRLAVRGETAVVPVAGGDRHGAYAGRQGRRRQPRGDYSPE